MFSTTSKSSSAEASTADVTGPKKNGSHKAGALPPMAYKPFGARARKRSQLQQQQHATQNQHEDDSLSSFLLWGASTTPTPTPTPTTAESPKEETRAPVVESSSSSNSRNNDNNSNTTNVRDSVPTEDTSSVLATLFGTGVETKKQRKIVYKTFGNDPIKLLEIVTEDGIPEPASERDVVIKVAVRRVLRLR
jgi:hypothetical protein